MSGEREHVLDGAACWCKPHEVEVDGGVIVIHNDALGLQLGLAPRHVSAEDQL